MIGSSLVSGKLRFRICRSIGGITRFVMAVVVDIERDWEKDEGEAKQKLW